MCVEEGDLRLADGGTSEDSAAQYGRLEIFAHRGWGTVCRTPLDSYGPTGLGRIDAWHQSQYHSPTGASTSRRSVAVDASVACKQMGFAEGFAMQPAVRAVHPQ